MTDSCSARFSRALEVVAGALEDALTEHCGEKPAFVISIAPFNDSKARVTYLSNMSPIQAAEILRKTADVIEAGGAPMAHKMGELS